MPYARPWVITDPPGTTLAKDIDQKIRDLRQDIDERLEDVLVVDMAADPLVLQTDLFSSVRVMDYDHALGVGLKKTTDVESPRALVVKSTAIIPGTGAWDAGEIRLVLSELGIVLADVFAFKAQVWFEDETDSGIGFTLYVSSVWKVVASEELAAQVRAGGGASYSGPAAVSLLWIIWLV